MINKNIQKVIYEIQDKFHFFKTIVTMVTGKAVNSDVRQQYNIVSSRNISLLITIILTGNLLCSEINASVLCGCFFKRETASTIEQLTFSQDSI